jgi:hypothetical protein
MALSIVEAWRNISGAEIAIVTAPNLVELSQRLTTIEMVFEQLKDLIAVAANDSGKIVLCPGARYGLAK